MVDDHTGDAELRQQFLNWMDDAIQALDEIEARGADPLDDQWVKDLYEIVHNIKGMGSSFGFDLLSAIGSSMGQYVKRKPEQMPWNRAVFTAHLKALRVVYKEQIDGNGGDLGAQVIAKLEARVADALSS